MSSIPMVEGWVLDSSTLLNAIIVDKVWIVTMTRRPLFLPEYVYRIELGSGARPQTRHVAETLVTRAHASVEQLTLADLERIAALCAPKRIGTGEICCAIIAERANRGVLCDDRKAYRWLSKRVRVEVWESIEEILVAGGVTNHLSEFDVAECEDVLAKNRYKCKYNLRFELLRRRTIAAD